jgi:hypothetical protein
MGQNPLQKLNENPDLVEKVRAAGIELAMAAPGLVDNDPYLAFTALMVATCQVGAIVNMSYEDVVKLIGEQFQYVVREQAAREASKDGAPVMMLPKPREAA